MPLDMTEHLCGGLDTQHSSAPTSQHCSRCQVCLSCLSPQGGWAGQTVAGEFCSCGCRDPAVCSCSFPGKMLPKTTGGSLLDGQAQSDCEITGDCEDIEAAAAIR